MPTSRLSKNFAQFLRISRGMMTQAEFSRFLGISHQQTYQRYEKGLIPSGEILHGLAGRLGVSIDRLLSGAVDAPPQAEQLRLLRERICSTVAQLGACVSAIENYEAELSMPNRPSTPDAVDQHLDEMGYAVDAAGEHLTSVSDAVDALQKAIAAQKGGA